MSTTYAIISDIVELNHSEGSDRLDQVEIRKDNYVLKITSLHYRDAIFRADEIVKIIQKHKREWYINFSWDNKPSITIV